MSQPERIIVIAAMTGIVAAGFTWFTCELCENICAVIVRRKKTAEKEKEQETAQELETRHEQQQQ